MRVAVGVVDPLEQVDVEQHDRRRVPVANRIAPKRAGLVVKGAPVVQTRERVQLRQPLGTQSFFLAHAQLVGQRQGEQRGIELHADFHGTECPAVVGNEAPHRQGRQQGAHHGREGGDEEILRRLLAYADRDDTQQQHDDAEQERKGKCSQQRIFLVAQQDGGRQQGAEYGTKPNHRLAHPRENHPQIQEANGEHEAAGAIQEHQDRVGPLLPVHRIGPQPGETMAGVGDVHGDEHRQVERVEQVARTAQAGEKNGVVCHQGEQETVNDPIAELLLHLPESRGLRVQQVEGDDHGVGRLHADEDIAGPRIERVVEHEVTALDGALCEGLRVADPIARDRPAPILDIDLHAVEPGCLDGQDFLQRRRGRVVHRKMDPGGFRADTEIQDRAVARGKPPGLIGRDRVRQGEPALLLFQECRRPADGRLMIEDSRQGRRGCQRAAQKSQHAGKPEYPSEKRAAHVRRRFRDELTPCGRPRRPASRTRPP